MRKKSIAPACHISVKIESLNFDMATELENLRASVRSGAVGAMVSFLGLCRDEDGRLAALEIEHFPAMAEREITRLATTAAKRWPLQAVHVIHRYGRINIGEEIVLVGVASAHRQAAFTAAEWLMDSLKVQAPFWKKQHWREGRAPEWVMVNAQDYERRQRW